MLDTVQLLERIRGGDRAAVELLMMRHRDLLREIVEKKLWPTLRNRVDPSDVVQETQLEIARRLQDYLQREPMPFQAWLRKTAYQNVARIHRYHLQASLRDRRQEIDLPASVSLLLVDRIVCPRGEPLEELVRKELASRVQAAVQSLSAADREVLLLRAYDGLDNQSLAELLNVDPRTCSKRYSRALLKLRRLLLQGDPELPS